MKLKQIIGFLILFLFGNIVWAQEEPQQDKKKTKARTEQKKIKRVPNAKKKVLKRKSNAQKKKLKTAVRRAKNLRNKGKR